jgi:cell division protein FtsB
MTGERVAPLAWIGQKLDAHLWPIIAAALAAYGGHVTGMTRLGETEKDIAALQAKHEKDIESLEAQIDALAPRVERLDAQAEMAKEQRRKG